MKRIKIMKADKLNLVRNSKRIRKNYDKCKKERQIRKLQFSGVT